jgi:erythromycin esterase-like protein
LERCGAGTAGDPSQSTATRDLFGWLCQYNQRHPSDPVSFHGFDTQEPWNQGLTLEAFFGKAASSAASGLMGGLAACDGATTSSQDDYYAQHPNGGAVSDAQRAQCQTAVAAARMFMATNAELINASSQEELTLAGLALDGLSSWEDEVYYDGKGDAAASDLARDREMAATLETIRKLWFAEAKAFVWAHNGHLAKAGEQVGFVHDMGATLFDDLGNDYYPIGLFAYRVDIDWPGVGTPSACQAFAPPEANDAVEKQLHQLGRGALLVDLAFPSSSPFFSPTLSYEFNSDGGQGWTGSIQRQFSGLVFLDHSPAMIPLQWAPCR